MPISKYLFLDMYDSLSNEIRFLFKSEVRIKVLKSLFNDPKDMKELNDLVLLSYSSISNNLLKLQNNGFLIKENRKFYMTNVAILSFLFCMDFNNSIQVSNIFLDFLKTHDIAPLCDDSLRDISSLKGARLVESRSVDISKPHEEFKNYLSSSKNLKLIFSYLHSDYYKIIKKLLSQDVSVEILINEDLVDVFINQLGEDFVKNEVNKGNLTIKYLTEKVKLSLAVSDFFVSMGLFKLDGCYDQNRLIISEEPSAILWGNSLFEKHSKKALFVNLKN